MVFPGSLDCFGCLVICRIVRKSMLTAELTRETFFVGAGYQSLARLLREGLRGAKHVEAPLNAVMHKYWELD
jgi:hypothetical protein